VKAEMRAYGLSDEQQDEVWAALRAGESLSRIARHRRLPLQHVRRFFAQTGGVRPHPHRRAQRHLSVAEREEISRGLARGASMRMIGARLGRSHSTVVREVARNGGCAAYRAHEADQQAYVRALRPKMSKLAGRCTGWPTTTPTIRKSARWRPIWPGGPARMRSSWPN
jgi:Helix-turn-helix domain